ncbi:MAG: phage head closure protein [Pseudohongiellaceae bacterium]|nr:phage head closure protein [Pseudohongiellaceae bacterium]
MINSDNMRHRCTIQYRSETQDPTYGTSVASWQTLATRWGNVQDVLPSKSEFIQDGVELSASQSRLRMRYWTDISSDMRIVVDGVTYQIVSGPAVLGDKDGIEMMIEKVSS